MDLFKEIEGNVERDLDRYYHVSMMRPPEYLSVRRPTGEITYIESLFYTLTSIIILFLLIQKQVEV